jgi:hypothetical protein
MRLVAGSPAPILRVITYVSVPPGEMLPMYFEPITPIASEGAVQRNKRIIMAEIAIFIDENC